MERLPAANNCVCDACIKAEAQLDCEVTTDVNDQYGWDVMPDDDFQTADRDYAARRADLRDLWRREY